MPNMSCLRKKAELKSYKKYKRKNEHQRLDGGLHRMCKNHNNTRHSKDHCRPFSQQQHQRRRTPFWSWTKYRRTQYFLLNAHLYLFFIRNFKTIVLESSINDNCSFYPAHFAEKFHHYPVVTSYEKIM